MDRRYLVVLGALITQFMIIGLFFVYSLLIKELETGVWLVPHHPLHWRVDRRHDDG